MLKWEVSVFAFRWMVVAAYMWIPRRLGFFGGKRVCLYIQIGKDRTLGLEDFEY